MKRSKKITLQSKRIEKQKTIDIKSVNKKSRKTLHKLSKNVRPAKKVSQLFNTGKILNSPLYSKTKKREIFSGENYAKLTK